MEIGFVGSIMVFDGCSLVHNEIFNVKGLFWYLMIF